MPALRRRRQPTALRRSRATRCSIRPMTFIDGEYGRKPCPPPRKGIATACGPRSSRRDGNPPATRWPALLTNHVRPVLLVFKTTGIHQLSIHRKVLFHLDRKRCRVSLRVVNRNLDFQPPVADR